MENYDVNNIETLNLEDLPNSSYNIFLGKRRSGKSYLCEYVVQKLIDMGKADMVFLFSETNAGFDFIKYDFRYKEIDELRNLVEKYKYMNNYNKLVSERNKIKLKTIVIIDDCAIKLKSKEFNILEELSVNGRHAAYPPLSLHFFILAQSLTKIPRVCRLNCDNIFLNAIASEHERAMVLDENMYLIDGSRQGKNMGRNLYQSLVASDDFVFMVIENWRQNATEYKHYIKRIKAD